MKYKIVIIDPDRQERRLFMGILGKKYEVIFADTVNDGYSAITSNNADIIISKGQANFETLRYCGKNIYYIFMCKCQMFADRFGVPKLSGMLLNDLRMK